MLPHTMSCKMYRNNLGMLILPWVKSYNIVTACEIFVAFTEQLNFQI